MSTQQPRSARLAALACAVALAVVLAGHAAAGDTPHATLRDFQLSGQYVLHVDGKLVSAAKIHHSRRGAAYLILADAFEDPVLVLQRTRRVESLPEASLIERETGGFDVSADAETSDHGPFKLMGTDVTFKVEDLEVRLKPRPPLTGTHWSKKIVEHSPEYARAAKVYRPDPAKMKILADSEMEARVQIFFGTWCTFCNKFLPNTLKVEEELKKEGTKIRFEFHGLPPPPAAWVTKEATQMRVKRLPTGLIFVGGKQVGRLEGNDWIKPERALSRYLK